MTGKIFRPGRSDSFYVSFPDYLVETKDWLSQRESTSRIVTYPDDNLETFEWGYRGTESILGLFSSQEVIAPSFVNVNSDIGSMLDNYYLHLKKGEYGSAIAMMPFMNVGTLMVKNDASSHAKKIENIDDLERTDIGEWTFYDIDQEPEKIFVSSGFYSKDKDARILGDVVEILDNSKAIVNFSDTEVIKIDDTVGGYFTESSRLSFDDNPTSNLQQYKIEVPRDGEYTLAIQKDGFNIDQIVATSPTIDFTSSIINETDSYYLIENVGITLGGHVLEVEYPLLSNMVTRQNIESAYNAPGLREEELPDEDFVIVAYNEAITEDVSDIPIPIPDFNPYHTYEISLDYKYVYGESPDVVAFQFTPTTPLKAESIDTGITTDWTKVDHTFVPAEIDSNFRLVIKTLPRQGIYESKTFIDNISMKRIYDNKVFIIEEPSSADTLLPKISFEKISPVEYKVVAEGVGGNYVLVFAENYSPDWVIKSDSSIGKPLHFTVNGYANGWYIAGNEDTQEFTIYYRGQTYYYTGAFISLVTLLLCLSYPLISKYATKRKDSEK